MGSNYGSTMGVLLKQPRALQPFISIPSGSSPQDSVGSYTVLIPFEHDWTLYLQHKFHFEDASFLFHPGSQGSGNVFTCNIEQTYKHLTAGQLMNYSVYISMITAPIIEV